MRVVPLGDQAVLVYLTDEGEAVRLAGAVQSANPPWLQDVVPAYASVGIFFDPDATRLEGVVDWLQTRWGQLSSDVATTSGSQKQYRVPVCYELQQDLARVCEHTGLSAEDVIRLHTGSEYTVYAIGFVPGFPYLGYLPPQLCGVGRLSSPRLRVEPGSVGLTGRQTGIYPLARPGGWNLIGRTPLVLVDVQAGFFPLRVGDRVRFERIDEGEFGRLLGTRLS